MQNYSPNVDLTLDEVKQKLHSWRSTRAKGEKIPEELWRQTLTLLQHYPISKIASTLSMSYSQIKTKAAYLSVNLPQVETNNNFIEINMDNKPMIPAGKHKTAAPVKNNSCTVELKRADGASLIIHDFNNISAIKFAESFLK